MSTLPDRVASMFMDKVAIPLQELAPAMGMDIKTLRRHRAAGTLPVHIKGLGLVRRHYVCTLDDVLEFYRRTGDACQSLRSKNLPITNSTSRSKVLDFPGQRRNGMNVTLRKSKGKGVLKQSVSLPTVSPQDASR